MTTTDAGSLDIGSITADGLVMRDFPAASPFRVLIASPAYATMAQHARATLRDGDEIKEVGGILVGELYRDTNGPYLEVSAAIVAEHTRNEGTEVAFTPDTWAQVNRVKDRDHPQRRIVGWYHTHPNFGIFLSERDQFLHRHSFPQPWGVAFVIDPVQKSEGLFVWRSGELREAPEYWVGDDRRMARAGQPPEPTSAVASVAQTAESRGSWLLPLAAATILVLAVVVLAYGREMARAERDALIVRALESERLELDRTLQILQALRAEIDRVAKQSASDISEVRGQTEQLQGGLRKLNRIALDLERRVQGQDEDPRVSGGRTQQ